jgi:hypothetical protein
MNETPSSSTDKTVVIDRTHRRLWILTIASLSLNGIIILFLIFAVIAHHHEERHHHRHGGGGGMGCGCGREGFGGGFRHFHHFGHGGMGWGGMDRGGMGGDRFGGEGHPFGEMGPKDGGPADFGPGPMHGGEKDMDFEHHHHDHGMGMDRGMGMGPGMKDFHGPPDPARMADAILNHLTKTLNLTDDQKAKIKPIIEAQVQAQQQAMEKGLQDTKDKLKPILDADQQKLLDSLPTPGEKPADTTNTPAAK